MGSLAPELGLDLKLFGESTIDGFLEDEIPGGGTGGRAAKLEGFVRRLEEERRKIEAFKRELPFCMILLTDVIGGLKLELEQCESREHVVPEFISLKSKLEGGEEELGAVKVEKDKEKMDWMSSAQLWSDNCSDESVDCKRDSDEKITGESDVRRDGEVLSLEIKRKSSDAGAFVPFKITPASRKQEEKLGFSLPDLSLVPTMVKASLSPATVEDENHVSSAELKSPLRTPAAASSSSGGTHLGLLTHQQQQQLPRKARRCWSPELHRRFVIALQQLGGAQVATPKQIRELMKIDGLTNDEVKSHLQKYRLHTRRILNSSPRASRPVVMVGGLWVSQRDHCSTSQQSASQSGSPQGPLQLACAAQAISVTGGDSCEDDCKSESYSWK
ncbi:Two-component response regulator ARR18 [Apostasia shenzhenica]|uniref:Two-component response regulator ARR18 n=1 Tax=Apostasia shenzhenica TaxID=1088818 RepID=A0A2I0AFH8_9ASPA|nr:Two-component response regulator ARR18 [Apostasia shenzhenica]